MPSRYDATERRDRHLVLVDPEALHIELPEVLTWHWPHDLTLPPPTRRLVLHGQHVREWNHEALQQLAWRFTGRDLQLIGCDLSAGTWGLTFLELLHKYQLALLGPVAS